jgi:aminoglycoside 6'-N-acetyltransferase I
LSAPRPVAREDIDAWIGMRAELWPYYSFADLQPDAEAFFAGRGALKAVLVYDGALGPIGMIEISERSYADGCVSSPVAFVEAWYVAEQARGQGIGRALMAGAAAWARAHGHTELGSDTQAWNIASQDAHSAIGFEEVGRNVHYRMKL